MPYSSHVEVTNYGGRSRILVVCDTRSGPSLNYSCLVTIMYIFLFQVKRRYIALSLKSVVLKVIYFDVQYSSN